MDPESRITRLEEQAKSHGHRIQSVENRMDSFAPIFVQVATLSEKVATAHAAVQSLAASFEAFRKKQEERDDDARTDRMQFNRWLIGLAVVIIASLISVAGLILSQGVHP